MSDCDFGTDAGSYDGCTFGRFSWPRLFLKCVILYAIIAFLCWDEIRFRTSSIEVTAQVESVGTEKRPLVRYNFHDETGKRRRNTVAVAPTQRPQGATATVQYIPGSPPSSRLASQAKPWIVTVFVTINGMLAAAAAGVIGYAAWEANHKPLTPQQRAALAYRRKKQKLAAAKGPPSRLRAAR